MPIETRNLAIKARYFAATMHRWGGEKSEGAGNNLVGELHLCLGVGNIQ